ncbi:hypothetical protein F5J12DRAFT_912503 [Pisolithus orientalis]|uniref:uncharacterized protein n=1 Tax=Pisolithus orientalis TaxID=936130 RepID=UPI002223EF34|nr:uncharacterized protein F5J12DRAFT_912503 [Pisolithus orientalis]KAI6008685.1 hypothetical protein F5J12DRAFT_912503 [Pisolithus orientalis]
MVSLLVKTVDQRLLSVSPYSLKPLAHIALVHVLLSLVLPLPLTFLLPGPTVSSITALTGLDNPTRLLNFQPTITITQTIPRPFSTPPSSYR